MKLYVTYMPTTAQRDCYSVVEASSLEACRRLVNDVTLGRYAFWYNEQAWRERKLVERYALREIPLQPQTREEYPA